MFEKLFLCGDYSQKLQHASCTSVLTSLIQTCFWSIINNLVIVNRWTEVLVTASGKFKGIKWVLHFSGTPHLPIHSIPPRIIISLISQGLFKLCVSYRFAVSMSSIKSGTSCIWKWDWKDESYLLAFVCHSSIQSDRLDSVPLSLVCSTYHRKSKQTGWLCFCINGTGGTNKESRMQELLFYL